MKHDRHHIVIAGAGRLGARLAIELSSMGHQVVIIDADEAALNHLPLSFGGVTMLADARDLDVLKAARLSAARFFIAATDNDNLNLMLSQLARASFGTPHVLARQSDPARQPLYTALGIQTISPVSLAATSALNALEFLS